MFTVLPFGWVIVMAFFVAARVVFRDRDFFDLAPDDGKASTRQRRAARVSGKRQHISGGTRHWPTTTDYFVTFENRDDGLRQEFAVSPSDYSALAEGDTGDLTSSGTKYLGFDRHLGTSGGTPSTPKGKPTAVKVCSYCGSALPHDKLKCPNCGWGWRPESLHGKG